MVAVILLASDLPEQSRAFPGDGKQPVPALCSPKSSLSSRGWCPGQQKNHCDPPQGSHLPLCSPCSRGQRQPQPWFWGMADFRAGCCHGISAALQISALSGSFSSLECSHFLRIKVSSNRSQAMHLFYSPLGKNFLPPLCVPARAGVEASKRRQPRCAGHVMVRTTMLSYGKK